MMDNHSGGKTATINVGDEYKGYRNSKWIKLDPNDFTNLTGKIYSTSKK